MAVSGIHRQGGAGVVGGGEDQLAVLRFEGGERNDFFVRSRSRRHVKALTGILSIDEVRSIPARESERLAVGRKRHGHIPAFDCLPAGTALAGVRGGDFRWFRRLAGGKEEKSGGEEKQGAFHCVGYFIW